MKLNLTQVVDFFKTAKKEDVVELTDGLTKAGADQATIDAVKKAAQDLTEAEHVSDKWQEGQMNAHATKEEVKTGPAQEASGSGAPKMISQYSAPTPQTGTQLTAESFQRIMGAFGASMKANTDAILSLCAATKSMGDNFAKAAESTAPKDNTITEFNAGRADVYFTKAKAHLAEAKKAIQEAAVSEGAEKKTAKIAALAAREDAAVCIGKALQHASGAGTKADALLTKINDFAAKADIEAEMKSEMEEEKEEKEEKSKKAKKADSMEGSGDEEDEDAKEEDKSKKAKKSSDIQALADQVKAAVEGYGMLQTDVRGLMQVMQGRGFQPTLAPAPDFAKSLMGSLTDGSDISDEIDSAEDNGQITMSDAVGARDIASKVKLVATGNLDRSVVLGALSKAHPTVQLIFAKVKTSLAA